LESAGNISGIGIQKSLFDCLLAGTPGSFVAKIYSSVVLNYPLCGSLIVMLLKSLNLNFLTANLHFELSLEIESFI
jgi:hypothetical protein